MSYPETSEAAFVASKGGSDERSAKSGCPTNSPAQAGRQDPREACTATMRRALDFLQPDPKAVFEVSIFNPKHQRQDACWPGFTPDNAVVVGWFDNRVKAANLAHSVDRIHTPSAIYVTLNRVDPALLARTNNELQVSKKGGGRTSDADIIHLDNLLIDIDAAPKSGISTTGEEKAAAKATLDAVVAFLTERGFPEPMVADSGNGFHAIYPIDLPVEDAPIVSGILNALAARFDHGDVRVDRTVGNPARITKFYGSMVRKGANVPDRPWRLSGILSVPENRVTVPHDLLVALAGEAKAGDKTKAKDSFGDYVGRYLDVDSYAEDHGLSIKARKRFDDSGTMAFILAECPFNPEHNRGEAAIFQKANGALSFKCKHNSCQDKGWKEAKKAISGDESLDRWMVGPKTEEKKEGNPWLDVDIHAFSLKSYLKAAPSPLDYAFGNLRIGNVGIVVGPPGTGKTHWCQHVAASVATGNPSYMDGLFTVKQKGRVLILSAEDDREAVHDRVWRQFQDAFEPFGDAGDEALAQAKVDLEENLHVFPAAGMDIRLVQKTPTGPVALMDFKNMREWMAQLENLRLVILDPMVKFYGGDENDNAFADYFFNRLVQWAQELKVAILCAHHTVKGFQKTSAGKFSLDTALHQDAARGASAFTGAAAWQYNLIPLPDDEAKKRITDYQKGRNYLAGKVSKCRYGKKTEPTFYEVMPDGMLHVVEGKFDKVGELAQTALMDVIVEEIRRKESAGEQLMTPSAFSEFYGPKWKDLGSSVRIVDGLVKGMVSEGRLFKVSRKYNRVTYDYLASKPDELSSDTGHPDSVPT